MRSAKDRTIERKRRQKATGAKRTERSRARRLANKHKREEIHTIDPDMKVVVINQKTFDQHGTEIEVMDGKVRAVTPVIKEVVETYDAESDGGRAIDDQIEKERLGMFDRLADRFKKK